MTKLMYVVLAGILSVGCAAEQLDDGDVAGTSYSSQGTLDLLAGELPEPLRAAYDLDGEGGELDLETQRALYEFGVTHRTDARPWLLLAHDAMRSETYGFAVRYYSSAIKADARAAQHQGVLGDLLRVVRVCGGAAEQREAGELVESSYGRDAAHAIDDALVVAIAQQDSAGEGRLRALLERVDPEPEAAVRSLRSCFAKSCPETAE
jgi:hypothetical protein